MSSRTPRQSRISIARTNATSWKKAKPFGEESPYFHTQEYVATPGMSCTECGKRARGVSGEHMVAPFPSARPHEILWCSPCATRKIARVTGMPYILNPDYSRMSQKDLVRAYLQGYAAYQEAAADRGYALRKLDNASPREEAAARREFDAAAAVAAEAEAAYNQIFPLLTEETKQKYLTMRAVASQRMDGTSSIQSAPQDVSRVRTMSRRNPSNYDIKWEHHPKWGEDILDYTPIRSAYPNSWITSGIERLSRGGAVGYVTVITEDHGDSMVETREMDRTLKQFDIHPDRSGMIAFDQASQPGSFQEKLRGFDGGRPIRAYHGKFSFKSVDESKAFVGRVIAALQNSTEKFELGGSEIRLRKNPSEYWKKNIQKALKAHQDRRPYVLGDIYSDRDDRDLSGLDLRGADLRIAHLYNADLSEADLSGADLTGANLSGAYLARADLTGAKLCRADLSEANLFGANLTGADLISANLGGTNLLHANLTNAYLYRAKGLTEDYMTGANLTGATMPDGTRHK